MVIQLYSSRRGLREMPDDGETMGEVVARHSAWIKGHEDLCAQRFQTVNDSLKMLFCVVGAGLAILVGISGWSLKTNWDNNTAQLQALEHLKEPAIRP